MHAHLGFFRVRLSPLLDMYTLEKERERERESMRRDARVTDVFYAKTETRRKKKKKEKKKKKKRKTEMK